jgi:tetratricopeptide (TPR) repeat protein
MLERIYLKLGRYEAVRKLYRDVLAESPDNVGWLNRAAAFAASQGEYDAALADMDRCIALTAPESPQYVGYLGGKAQILALAYKRTSDNAYLEKAVAVYESLLEKTPKNDNSVILNNLAYMLAQGNRRLADALAYAKRALEQKPEEANYLDTYGYALYRNGRNAEAVESLTAAIRRYEAQGAPSADAYEHLGMVREALGEGREALSAYRRALEVGADAMPPIMRDRINSAIGRLMP